MFHEINMAVVNEPVVTIREKPDKNSGCIDEVLYGMVVSILDTVDDWLYIETQYDYKGYIPSNCIINDQKASEDWFKSVNAVVYHNIADVTIEPKYESNVLFMLTIGAFVIRTGKVIDRWSEIELPDKSLAWVRKEFLRAKPDKNHTEDEIRKNIVDAAFSYIGTQYRWGGKTPFGIDCSGLCSMAYMLNGFIIYRDAELKEDYMKRIDLKDIKPADLLFFAGHVAMYIGNKKFIHSNGKDGMVALGSLNPADKEYRDDLAKGILDVGSIF